MHASKEITPKKTSANNNSRANDTNGGKDIENLEYMLPFGWKKVGSKRKNGTLKNHVDFYLFSPDGQRFRSTNEVKEYLKQNPHVQCDLDVTHTRLPKNLKGLKVSHEYLKSAANDTQENDMIVNNAKKAVESSTKFILAKMIPRTGLLKAATST